jgi:hypothetical protein
VCRFILVAFLLIAAPAAAQIVPAGVCPGGRISFVFVDNNAIFDTADPDLDDRFRWAYEAANALHIRTRQWVIRRELLFAPGDCYDPFVLAETERVLRGYTFLAEVDVYGVRQTDGTHHVVVNTRDDWSTRIDLRLRFDDGIRFEGARLSELNFLGMGQTVGVFWYERDVARDYGLSYWAPQVGRSRWDLSAALGRTRAGTLFRQEIGYPFVGEIGHWAGREAYVRDEQFFDYVLLDDRDSASPHVLVPTRDKRFDLSVLRRFGDRGRALLAGLGVSSRQLEYPGSIDIAPGGNFEERVPADTITAAPVLAQTTVRDAVRVHVLLGARNVRWIERRGLDGMQGEEDIRLGFELGADIGRSIPAYGDDDITLAGLFYGAVEAGGSLLVARGRVDGTRDLGFSPGDSRWGDVFAGVELFAYLRRSADSPGTLLLRADAAGGWRTSTPFQLTLGGERGVRGFDRQRFPAGRRLVLTLEHRHYLGWPFGGLFDTGVSVFADGGRTWRGDSPFGVNSGWRVSAGTGLRFAFPAGSRATYRLDVAWPVDPRTTLGDFRVLFSIGELIGLGGAGNDVQLGRSRPDGVAADLFRFNAGPRS